MIYMEVLTDFVRTDFEGISIDFEIMYDITGKVLNSKPLIFDLPLNVQRLMLGKNQEEIRKQIKSFEDIIGLIIPLGIQNQETFFSIELGNIYTRINTILKEANFDLSCLYKYSEENSLEYYIHSSHSKKELYANDFHKIWDITKDLIINRNSNINIDSLRLLGYHYPQFGFKIIPLIIPFIKNSNTKRIAYENLEYYITQESLEYLKKELKTCKDGEALSGICKALSKHTLKDQDIQRDLINLYKSGIDLSEDSKANLLQALKHFPNRHSIEIGLEILKENNRYSSGYAARILLELGYPAKDIAEIMIPKLMAANPKESEAAFSILCNSDKYKDYMPKCSEILEVYVKTLEVNQNLNIAYSMPSIMKINYDKLTSEEIIKHLSNPNPNVLEGILILINCLMDESRINTGPFFSEIAKSRYIELLTHEKHKVVENSLKILQKIGRLERKQNYISLFLNVINFENNSLNNLYAMSAINYMLPVLRFQNEIIPYYKKALESTNYNYRVEALRGFRFSQDSKLKLSLNYLKDDPSEEVRREFNNLNKPAYGVNGTSLLINILKYIYIKIKYKGRTPSQGELLMEHLKKEVGKGNRIQNEKINNYKLK